MMHSPLPPAEWHNIDSIARNLYSRELVVLSRLAFIHTLAISMVLEPFRKGGVVQYTCFFLAEPKAQERGGSRFQQHIQEPKFPSGVWLGDAHTHTYSWRLPEERDSPVLQPFCPGHTLLQLPFAWCWALLPHC